MDPVDEFFASFPTFNYKRSASSPQEFRRMCSHFNWRKRPNGTYPAERQEASKIFRIAMVRSFNQNFGEGVEAKRAWVHLCTVLMVEPIPTSITDMKDVSKVFQPAECRFGTEHTLVQCRRCFEPMSTYRISLMVPALVHL